MNYSTSTFTLDLQKQNSQYTVSVFQNDTARRLRIAIRDESVPYEISDGCFAVFFGKREIDGSELYHPCEIEENSIVVYNFRKNTASIPGITNCEIRFFNGEVIEKEDENGDITYEVSGEMLAAAKFKLIVTENVYANDELDEEEQGRLNAFFLSEAKREANEAERQANEEVRRKNENDRQGALEELDKRVSEVENFFELDGESLDEARDTLIEIQKELESDDEMAADIIASLSKKLNKEDDPTIVYGTDGNGNQVTLSYSSLRLIDGIVQRRGYDILVPMTPNYEDGAVPKKYVDDIAKNKLDKSAEANKIYGTDEEGNQVEYSISEKESGGIVFRESDGQILVPTVPTRGEAAAPKAYVDTKVAQTTTPSRLYGTNASGAQTFHVFSTSVLPWHMIQRDAAGDVYVPDTPSSPSVAVPKMYVDGLVNPLEERVSNLESLTLKFTEDTATAYEKSIPAEVGKKALLKSFGGASVPLKNYLSPNFMGGNFTLNEDGSITVNVNGNGATSVVVSTYIPVGEYYLLWEELTPWKGSGRFLTVYFEDGNNDTYNASSGVISFPKNVTAVHIEFENIADFGGIVDNFAFTIKTMLTNGTEIPEFNPFLSEFKNAEVKRIESRGANVIPFPYVFGTRVMDVGYKEIINGVTFEVLENGLISAKGTATIIASLVFLNTIMPAGDYYISGNKTSGGSVVVGYNHNAPDNNSANNGAAVVNQKILHKGGLFRTYIKIDSGVTVDSIFKPIVTKDVYISEFKPYRAEPIDTLEIPIDEIKARVEGFGLGIDDTDYNGIYKEGNEIYYKQVCKELVLTGAEPNITLYPYSGMNGVSFFSILDTSYNRTKAICTDTDKTKISDLTSNSMWVGANNTILYWLGILDILGMTTVDEFRTYLANRYSNGDPVRIIYKLATPIITDITDLFPADSDVFEVEGGGYWRFENDNELPVPSTIQYVTRKE